MQGRVENCNEEKERSCWDTETGRIALPLRILTYTVAGFRVIRAPLKVHNMFLEKHMQNRKPKRGIGNVYTNHWNGHLNGGPYADGKLAGDGRAACTSWRSTSETRARDPRHHRGVEWAPSSPGAGTRYLTQSESETLELHSSPSCAYHGTCSYAPNCPPRQSRPLRDSHLQGRIDARPAVSRKPLVSSAIFNLKLDDVEPRRLEIVVGHDDIARNVTMLAGALVLNESQWVIHGRHFRLKGKFMADV
jgi:hypothetical protein